MLYTNTHLLIHLPQTPFPLRVTRVVTAVLPSSLVARRVSVEDPPAELDTPLPEQISPEMPQRADEQSKKLLNKPPRRLLLEAAGPNLSLVDTPQDQPVRKTSRQQGVSRNSKKELHSEVSKAEGTEPSSSQVQDQASLGNGSEIADIRVRNN